MPFKPGQSGNPAGRPTMPEELKVKIRAEIPKVVDFWISTYGNEAESFQNRNKAAENLVAYAYGKPKEIIDMDISGKLEGITVAIVDRSRASE
jgi:hypothetical protein